MANLTLREAVAVNMDLNWKLKKNGEEVAGPFKVAKTNNPYDAFRYGVYVGGTLMLLRPTRAQAKRAAQRIADKIVKNLEAKP